MKDLIIEGKGSNNAKNKNIWLQNNGQVIEGSADGSSMVSVTSDSVNTPAHNSQLTPNS